MTRQESYIRTILATLLSVYAFYSGYLLLILASLALYYTAFKKFCFMYTVFKINDRYSLKNYYLSLLPKYRTSPVFIFNNKGKVVFQNSVTEKLLPIINHSSDLNITDPKKIIDESVFEVMTYEHNDVIYQVEVVGEAQEQLVLAYFTDVTGMKLNEQIAQQKEELAKLHKYDTQQQEIAKEKLDSTFINDISDKSGCKSSVIYQASDILSGDFYSLHSFKNGATFIYVIDGQGHGISPALTVFGVSSTITHLVEEDISFEEIVSRLFPMIQRFLGEIEQLSYTMLYIDENKKDMHYLSGGMYPFMIKQGSEILTYKANNLPFMSFSQTPSINSISLDEWSDILIYTDGLVEDLDEDMSKYSPKNILEDEKLFKQLQENITQKRFEDDITVVKLSKISF